VFHPEGVVYRAEVRPLATEGDIGVVAQRLRGPALVRLSSGMSRWRSGRNERMPDVLGAAVRFRSSPDITPVASPDDQDLIFLTSRSLLLLPIALFTTDRRDFLANDYHAILPFEVAELGRVKFRLVPLRATKAPGTRIEKLDFAVASGLAVLRLEVRQTGIKHSWVTLADITLLENVDIDQEALRFDPFQAGRGIVPSGLLQTTRLATYTASYFGRSLAARARRSRG
jgi:hypothetical protein